MAELKELELENEQLRKLVFELQNKIVSLEQEVNKVEVIKGDFVNVAAHELRTPITVVKESLSQLLDKLFGDINDEQDNLLRLAMQNVDRLTGCVNRFIEESRNK